MDRPTVTTDQELTIRRQADEVVRRVVAGTVAFDFVSPRLQAIIVGSANETQVGEKKHNYFEIRRAELERAFHGAGLLVGSTIPMPMVDGKLISNREFDRRRKLEIPQALFVQPPQSIWTRDAHMRAFGQRGYWTVGDNDVNAKMIGWEPVDDWRWFWMEISDDCPRLGTSWDILNTIIRQPSLEEYEIGWHLHKAITGKKLDVRFRTWLCTRFGRSGALDAGGYDGGVSVGGRRASELAGLWSGHGGRAVEVV